MARTGRWGWGSRQFTWGREKGAAGCPCVCVSPQTGHRDQPQHPQALRWPSSPSPPPRVRVSQSEGRWGALAGVGEVGFCGTPPSRERMPPPASPRSGSGKEVCRGGEANEGGEPQPQQQTQGERGPHPSQGAEAQLRLSGRSSHRIRPRTGSAGWGWRCQQPPGAGTLPRPPGQKATVGPAEERGSGDRLGREQRGGLCHPSPRQRATCRPLAANPKPAPAQEPRVPPARPVPGQPCARGGTGTDCRGGTRDRMSAGSEPKAGTDPPPPAAAARDLTAVGRSLGNWAQGRPWCSCVPFLDVRTQLCAQRGAAPGSGPAARSSPRRPHASPLGRGGKGKGLPHPGQQQLRGPHPSVG